MNQDNKNAMIGMVLILFILLGWNMFTAPSEAEKILKQRTQDSIAIVQRTTDSLQIATTPATVTPPSISDSLKRVQLTSEMGDFSALAVGTEQLSVLENEDLKVSEGTEATKGNPETPFNTGAVRKKATQESDLKKRKMVTRLTL